MTFISFFSSCGMRHPFVGLLGMIRSFTAWSNAWWSTMWVPRTKRLDSPSSFTLLYRGTLPLVLIWLYIFWMSRDVSFSSLIWPMPGMMWCSM